MSQVSKDIIDYEKVTIDLSSARTDILFSSATILNAAANGKALTVLKQTTGATWSIKLVKIDGTDGDTIDQTELSAGSTLGIDYKDIKITNSAQASVSVTFLIQR